MKTLVDSMHSIEYGFLTNDKNITKNSIDNFKVQINKIFNSEDIIKNFLPHKLKHKSSTAINSVKIINRSILEIEKVLADENIRVVNRQRRTQKSFLEIQNQCYRCHNLMIN